MKKPVILDTRKFDTQSEATAFFRVILNRYAPGQRLADTDAAMVEELLQRHPESKTKIGVGVDHFEIMLTEHGSQGFRICRIDGTGTDFSYLTCIRAAAPTRRQELNSALRAEIKPQIRAARDQFIAEYAATNGLFACAVTGEVISIETAHIDHLPPLTFEVIVETFLRGSGQTPEDVAISMGQDEQTTPVILDGDFVDRFLRYHSRIAEIDMVKAGVNLAQSARNRIRRGRMRLRTPETASGRPKW